jgi:hypothetical protein
MSLSEAQRAIVSLQNRALRTNEGYTLDVLDRALDEVVRNYDNPKPAPWQARSALANAAKVVQSRRDTVGTISLDDEARSQDVGDTDGGFAVVDLRDWLDRTSAVTDEQRSLLIGIADGHGPAQLAQDRGVPIQRMRERLSRARSRARTAFDRAAAA